MQEADSRVLRECALQAAQDVFAACSVSADFADASVREVAGEPFVAAFIGFGGAHARGMLTVMAPFDVLQRAHPVLGAEGDGAVEADVLDWAGEIANLLLGRIRNGLARRGVELQISTPKSLLATRTWMRTAPCACVCLLQSVTDGDTTIGIWLDAVLEEGIQLSAEASTEPGAVAEGDQLFF